MLVNGGNPPPQRLSPQPSDLETGSESAPFDPQDDVETATPQNGTREGNAFVIAPLDPDPVRGPHVSVSWGNRNSLSHVQRLGCALLAMLLIIVMAAGTLAISGQLSEQALRLVRSEG